MMAVKSRRLCATLVAALLAGGCTYNYNNRIEHPPQPETATATARCSMVWSGVVPSGWTVRELRRFVATIPESGCPKVELRVHRSGLPVSWDSSLGDDSNGWVVRSALTQYADTGEGPLRRIHAFAEPAEGPPPNPETGGDGNGEGNSSQGGNDGQGGGPGNRDQTPSTDGTGGGAVPPDIPAPGPDDRNPPDTIPPPTGPGPDVPPPGEEAGGGPAGARDPDTRPSAWVARNGPPALVGGGVVYGLVYLNLIGVPAAGRVAPLGSRDPMRRRGGRPEEEEAEEAVAAALGGAPPAGDRRVRIRSSGFEGPSA